MSGSRKYTNIISPLAPFLSTGPPIRFTPQKFRWVITAERDTEVIKQTSAEPGVGFSAFKALSRPSCYKLIFCDPKDRAFLFSPKVTISIPAPSRRTYRLHQCLLPSKPRGRGCQSSLGTSRE